MPGDRRLPLPLDFGGLDLRLTIVPLLYPSESLLLSEVKLATG